MACKMPLTAPLTTHGAQMNLMAWTFGMKLTCETCGCVAYRPFFIALVGLPHGLRVDLVCPVKICAKRRGGGVRLRECTHAAARADAAPQQWPGCGLDRRGLGRRATAARA